MRYFQHFPEYGIVIWWQGLLKDTEKVSVQGRIRTMQHLKHLSGTIPLPRPSFQLCWDLHQEAMSKKETPKVPPAGLLPLTIQRGLWGGSNSILPWEHTALVGFPQAAL